MKQLIQKFVKCVCVLIFTTFLTNQNTQAQSHFTDYEAWYGANNPSVQSEDYVPNQLIVVTVTPVLWNKNLQNVEELTSVFPAGSKITACADACLHTQNREDVLNGIYLGTQFLVTLPSANAKAFIQDESPKILASQKLIKNLWLNHIGKLQSSSPIAFNDPNFLNMQNHIYYNTAAIAAGVKYTGWQHAQGFVPKNSNKVLIAVLDGGVNFQHEDLQGSPWINTAEIPGDLTDNDGNGLVDDYRGWDYISNDNDPEDGAGHGTGVFSVIAARNNNTKTICGVITDTAATMVLKVSNAANVVFEFATVSAYNYALSKNAKVINMSLGFASCPSLMAAVQNGVPIGVVPVAATGNSGLNENFYPAVGASVISVGSCNIMGVKSGFSTYNDSINIMATGENIKIDEYSNNTGIATTQGTSFSAPQIAGFCQILKKIDTTFTVGQITQMINSCGRTYPAFSQTDGYGAFVRFDSLLRRLAFPDTVVTYTACTGVQNLPNSKYFLFVDSLKYGVPAIVGNTINTNLISAGTYPCYFAWKSEPRPGVFYYDTIKFTVNILPGGGVGSPTINITANPAVPVCAGTSVTFNSTITNGGPSPSYQWKKNGVDVGSNSPTYTYVPANGDQIYCVLTSNAPCLATNTATSSTIVMTVNALPNVGASVTPNATVCAGTSVTLTGNGANTYAWSGGVTNGIAFTPAGTSTYTVVGTDGNTCTNTTSITVTVNPLPPLVVGSNPVSGAVCPGGQVTLTATGAATYSWTGGITNGVAFTPIATTTYTVTGTLAGCSSTATKLVTVNSLPNVGASVSPNDTVCSGDQITLNGNGANTYVWSGGATNGVAFTPAASLTYTVTGTDMNTCTNTAVISITVNTNTVPTATVFVSTAVDANNHKIATYTLASSAGIDHIDWYLSGVFQTSTVVDTWIRQIPDNKADTLYAVLFTSGGCFDPDTAITNQLVTTGTVTGFADLVPEGFDLYPNPTQSTFMVEGVREGDKVQIFNAIGQVVYTQTFQQKAEKVDISLLAAGLYLAHFIREDQRWVIKVLKK